MLKLERRRGVFHLGRNTKDRSLIKCQEFLRKCNFGPFTTVSTRKIPLFFPSPWIPSQTASWPTFDRYATTTIEILTTFWCSTKQTKILKCLKMWMPPALNLWMSCWWKEQLTSSALSTQTIKKKSKKWREYYQKMRMCIFATVVLWRKKNKRAWILSKNRFKEKWTCFVKK